ncbi:MAG TPA: tRNA (adenosine(37)-N6)-threonylcarbamoyltransferase complex dimerization subunit type 1 TsaB [Nitrosospira sp.]|nr:tRNA (adenosine(37)-N6)-threonylcarbamoyltransferase complex dimerization subunit type 1 TsaB [Nitrosospira sp.]
MKILALDTSTEYCSVALLSDNDVTSREDYAGQRHSELILPMVRQVLADSGIALTDLDGITFGSGPGSFTGLRIACGITQGLAFGADLPVVGICTLEALAQEAGAEKVVTALDARMGEIYQAAYEKGPDEWQPVALPSLHRPENAPLLEGDNWTACGSGFDVYEDRLRIRYEGCVKRIIRQMRPNACAIARLAVRKFVKGQSDDPSEAVPLYIRNKVALKENER